MCLLLFAWHQHPDYPLVLAANRDEFYRRPSAPLRFWQDVPILGGRDLQAGGTWLGMDPQHRVAAVTNWRNGHALPGAQARSRGDLPRSFLARRTTAANYLREVYAARRHYNGFSLLLADPEELWYTGSETDGPQQLSAGVYGLANAGLDAPWPKVEQGKQALAAWLERRGSIADLLTILSNTEQPPDEALPSTGLEPSIERQVAPIFIRGERYGTRASSVVLRSADGDAIFIERRYGLGGTLEGETTAHWPAGARQPLLQTTHSPQ